MRIAYALTVVCLACDAPPSGPDCTTAEAAMTSALDAAPSEVPFTLLLRHASGRDFAYSRVGASPQAVYESASTSKWVTAMVLLRLVDAGILSLDDHPQEHLAFWTNDAPLADITLAQLLAFTSGLHEQSLCQNRPAVAFMDCAQDIYEANLADPGAAGADFHYGSSHLQIAGAMALEAAGAADWGALFADFQDQTGLFPTGRYDLPSEGNPRLAGGMHWTSAEYLDFLAAVYDDALLSEALAAASQVDRTQGLVVSSSPAADLGRDWHYAFGSWLECAACDTPRQSSPGAYGAYPFVDRARHYVGVLGRQGALGTFPEGLQTFESVAPEVAAWATCLDE